MEFSVTDRAGRRVAVTADNWLFAIAGGLRALEVDPDSLVEMACRAEEAGTILVDAGPEGRWWIRALDAQPGFPPPPLQAEKPWTAPEPDTSPHPLDDDLPGAPLSDFDEMGFESLPSTALEPLDDEPTPLEDAPGAELPPALEEPAEAAEEPAEAAEEPAEAAEEPAEAAEEPAEAVKEPAEAAKEPAEAAEEPAASAEPEATEDATSMLPDFEGDDDSLSEDAPTESISRNSLPRAVRPDPVEMPKTVTRVQRVVVSSRSYALGEDEDVPGFSEPSQFDNRTDGEEVFTSPGPALSMPSVSSLQREEPEGLAERLFELSMDLMGLEPDKAASVALDVVSQFVVCDAASIALGTLNDTELRYVAANGPVADQVVGLRVPFGVGLVGLCFDMRSTLVIDDAQTVKAHHREADETTGYQTGAVLCVPIVDDEGMVHGVIQLLNPVDRPFYDEDEEAVETIASTLAGALGY